MRYIHILLGCLFVITFYIQHFQLILYLLTTQLKVSESREVTVFWETLKKTNIYLLFFHAHSWKGTVVRRVPQNLYKIQFILQEQRLPPVQEKLVFESGYTEAKQLAENEAQFFENYAKNFHQ